MISAVTELGDPLLDDAPTKAETPASLAPDMVSARLAVDASGPSLAASTSSTIAVTTAQETMRLQEIGRTRAFARLAFVLALVVGVALAFVGGDRTAKLVMWATIVPVVATTAWLYWILRDEGAYTVARALVCGYACIVAALGGIHFFGAFSPACVVLPFGLYFFSSGQNFRATLFVYLACAGGYFALVFLVMAKLVPERGMVTGAHLSLLEQTIVLLLVEMTLLLTFVSSRASRTATLVAIERHDRVVRGLAQREALLREARQDLERALQVGGLGRFTDTTIGSFQLGKVIGRGAMGEVYEGTKRSAAGVTSLAAVKLLHGHALADPDLLKRFLREAKIAASLDTPHVVKVIEIGGLDAPLPYIAMERLQGEDLHDHLRRHRQLSVKKVITLVRHVGRGLEAARAAGIVHRDLKPRNVFLADAPDGGQLWKILDFGISKLGDADATQQTKDMIVGTPGYMAPEQAAGRTVTYATDLFALGVICYRALTGRPAFAGDHMAETLFQVTHGMPPRPSDTARVHEHVDLVIALAMAKRAEDRFESGAALAAALESASRGELEPALRARAEALLAKHPWNTSG